MPPPRMTPRFTVALQHMRASSSATLNDLPDLFSLDSLPSFSPRALVLKNLCVVPLLLAIPFRYAAAQTSATSKSSTRSNQNSGSVNQIERTVVANPQSPLVRVCLLRYAGVETVTVAATTGAHLIGAQGQEVASGLGPWTFHIAGGRVQVTDARGKKLGGNAVGGDDGSLWRIQQEDGAGQVAIRGADSAIRHYRGSLEIRPTEDGIRLINEVAMEPYLQAVVISEIGDGPIEALKAQVVAARTYAISSRGRWKSDGYDLRDSVDSQAYNGVEAETTDGNRAVRETNGQILTVNGVAIDSDFCDDCGGVTAPGDEPDILPRSVSDAEAHRYIRRAPYTNWTLAITPLKLKALLNSYPKARGQGTLLAVEIKQRDVSGRAQILRLKWSGAGESDNTDNSTEPRSSLPSRHSVRKRPHTAPHQPVTETPRQKPDQKAIGMETEINGERFRASVGYNVLRSTLFTIHRNENGDFVFEGHGWGHGHGLCQQGALALAAAPLKRDYKAILAHYYPGAIITRWQAALAEGVSERDGTSLPMNEQRSFNKSEPNLRVNNGR